MATETHRTSLRGSTSIEAATMRRMHPEWTLREIANPLGVSKERIRQVLGRAGLPTAARKPPKPTCDTCGVILRDGMRPKGTCALCLTEARYTYRACEVCGRMNRYKKTAIYRKTPNPFRQTLDQRHFYCNRVCFGRWFGTHHGVGARKKGATK